MSSCSALQGHMERALSARNLFHIAFLTLTGIERYTIKLNVGSLLRENLTSLAWGHDGR
jgi:hypothetical protein